MIIIYKPEVWLCNEPGIQIVQILYYNMLEEYSPSTAAVSTVQFMRGARGSKVSTTLTTMLRTSLVIAVLSAICFKLHMWYNSITISSADVEYDFIIVGGGTTGAVVANRLSEIKSNRILVLEAGSEDGYDPLVSIPLLMPLNRGRWNDWKFATEKQEHCSHIRKGNVEEISRGKLLGGTSAINFHLYVRGSRHNYESWAKQGADGWNFRRVLPYFIKSEKWTHSSTVDGTYRGNGGPLHVTLQEGVGMTRRFINAAEELGLHVLADYNGEKFDGVSPAQTTCKDGLRQTSTKAYLRPIAHLRRDQLHILVDAHVTKILFKESSSGRKVAVGVEYFKGGKYFNVSARKEVILSAGTYGTPQLLLLSGIGPTEQLDEFDIPVNVDLPGVGENLQDHPFLPLFLRINNSEEVIGVKKVIFSLPGYILNRSGPLGMMGGAIASLSLGDSNTKTQNGINSKHDTTNVQYLMVPTEIDWMSFKYLEEYSKRDDVGYKENIFDDSYSEAANIGSGILGSTILFASIVQPFSRGTTKLKSADPLQAPSIDARTYSDPRDSELMVKAIGWATNLTKTEAMKEVDAKLVVFHKRCKEHKESEEKYFRCIAESQAQLFHPCCTAKIGRHTDRMAVVDPQLRVYGVDRLRIADASVMPSIVSAPLQATCYMIGEKAADLIKETWSQL